LKRSISAHWRAFHCAISMSAAAFRRLISASAAAACRAISICACAAVTAGSADGSGSVLTAAPCSPAPSMPVRKYYSARRRRLALDRTEQCCGVCLLTLRKEDWHMGVLFPVILSRADLIRAEAKTCADRSRRDLTPVASGDEILSFGFAQDRRFAPGRSYSAGNDNCRHPRPATNVLATNVFRRPKWPALTALTAPTPDTCRHAMRRPGAV